MGLSFPIYVLILLAYHVMVPHSNHFGEIADYPDSQTCVLIQQYISPFCAP